MATASDVIDTRSGNALFPDATVSQQALNTVGNLVGDATSVAQFGQNPLRPILSWIYPKTVNREAEWFRKRQRGLWVHGKIVLSDRQLRFTPSSIDTYVHEAPESLNWSTSLSKITAVSLRRGLVADIIDIQSPSGLFSIRCFKAKAFVTEIEKARRA